jgi:hypothetical protein
MGTFAAAWPRQQLGPATIAVYVEALHDLPLDEVEAAMRTAIRMMRFPPTISELRGLIVDRQLGHPDAGAALELVEAAAAGTGSYSTLPEPAQRAVKAMGGMFSWRAAENPGIQRSQFLKLYDEFRQEARTALIAGEQRRQLPPAEPATPVAEEEPKALPWEEQARRARELADTIGRSMR